MILDKEVKSVLNKHKRRDAWFLDDYSVNPYEGCAFNCLYCYIRGSKYGENMSERLAVKSNAVAILDQQLFNRAKKNQHGFVVMASATDPYMEIENRYSLSRAFLELFLKHRFPVHIITKSKLVERDFDLLKEIDEAAILPEDLKPRLNRGVIISFSISTLDERLTSFLESGAPSPSERLEMITKCKAAGFLTGINCMPLLPFISDTDAQLEKMISTAKEAGADYVLAAGLTLFGNGKADSKTLYYRFLEKLYPGLLPKYDEIYKYSSFPPKIHQVQLQRKVIAQCSKYTIRNSILV
jgi:DNA repair photolyase